MTSEQETTAEAAAAVRATVDALFGRFMGIETAHGEAVQFLEELECRGFAVVPVGDAPDAADVATTVLDTGPLVTVNLNVSTTTDLLPEVLDQLREHGLAT